VKLILIAILYKHHFLPVSFFTFHYFNCSILIVQCAHDRGLYKSGAVAVWPKPTLTILKGFLTLCAHIRFIFTPPPPQYLMD
jgi:hypothetical protein